MASRFSIDPSLGAKEAKSRPSGAKKKKKKKKNSNSAQVTSFLEDKVTTSVEENANSKRSHHETSNLAGQKVKEENDEHFGDDTKIQLAMPTDVRECVNINNAETRISLTETPSFQDANGIGSQRKKGKKGKGHLVSDLVLAEPQIDSDNKEKEKPKEATKTINTDTAPQQASTTPDLDKFATNDTWLLQKQTKERNNFSKVVTIIYGVGLESLRQVFLQIHPNWSNKPDDAKNLKKGKMVLQKHDLALLNTGNINTWDVSLMTTVLLYTKKCANELALRPGYEDAIRRIKEQRNKLVGHVSSEKMSDATFHAVWQQISKDLVVIGAQKDDIDDIFQDYDVLERAKFYRDMLLEEISAKDDQRNMLQTEFQSMSAKIDNLETNMKNVVAEQLEAKLPRSKETTNDDKSGFKEIHGPHWDGWLDFRDNVHNFDFSNNNYILLTDALSKENLEHFSVLRSVPWKIVFDFDLFSEECGIYRDFVTKEAKNCLIDMYTPLEIGRRHASASNLARSIDTRKTQWMFVRGREKDSIVCAGRCPETVEEWKISSVKHLNGFLRCCSDLENLDKLKPLICIILPFLEENVPFLKVVLKRLVENFNEFPLRFVGIKNENIDVLSSRFGILLSPLSPRLLSLGLKDLLEISPGKEYCIPTWQADMPAKLTNNQLLHLQEYLEVLYSGCEELPKDEEETEKLEKIIDEHRKSFLSGNWIYFVSLFDNHDAQREIGKEIQNHIQRLLEKGSTHRSEIVEIHHLPGTGGSTIARRVLWELHKFFPCAIAKLEGYKYIEFDDDYHFVDALADRITEMHDICQTNPLILLDERHGSIEALCNKLVRKLNSRGQRAVLLSCLHCTTKVDEDGKYKELNPDIHRRFFVKGKLEDCVADRRAFEAKYKDYIDEMTGDGKTFRRSRVFHFPLLAMLKGLKGFRSKLEKIVFDSFDEMEGLQKEIAALVAFIQHYAVQETPASLVFKVFKQYISKGNKEQGITYEEINKLVTEHLLNLMVPAKPTRNHGNAASRTTAAPETYTFQHPIIADLVLWRYYKTQRCDVFTLTKRFLDFPIFQDDHFSTLVYELFIHRSSRKNKNSLLFEDLKSKNIQQASEVFCDLANKTGNAIVFAHAARFHVSKIPPSFPDAIKLVTEAFKCSNAKKKYRIICDMKGGILQSHLKFMVDNGEVTTIQMLEELATKAIKSFRDARTWPPRYPGPLTGEVKVWIHCIDWITTNVCQGDTDRAFKYINSPSVPSFFSTCINDSFHLLDVVDSIIENEPTLQEPGETRENVDSLRVSLLRTFSRNRLSRQMGTGNRDLIQTSSQICSSAHFPKSSQSQIKRLQAHFVLSQVKDVGKMKFEDRVFLLSLLEDLVLGNREVAGEYPCMAHYLMNVSLHVAGPKSYSLDKGLQVVDIWMQESSHNPKPHFYKMMINFLHILEGKQLICRDSYNKALSKCKELSENKCLRWVCTHFANKTGEGMNRLITKSGVVTGEPEYSKTIDSFWITEGRKKLLECSGRIRIRPKAGKRKRQVYIELVQGNVELYVSKNADIGNVGQDYPQGTMVYFVAGFNLDGPVAYGITFKPNQVT